MPDIVYPKGPFTPQTVKGGNDGDPFAACKWITNTSALVVKKLEVWWGTDCLHGVRITFADDSLPVSRGSKTNETSSITFAPGEQVTALTLWDSGADRAGRIRIVTDKQIFDVGRNTDADNIKFINAPVGSGILVGMCGKTGSAIDSLGAIFLEPNIDKITIDNVLYKPTLEGTSAGISQLTLDSVYYENPTTKTLDWKFANSSSRDVSTTFSQLTSTMYGVSVSTTVNASPFGIGASVTAGFQWQKTDSKESTTSTSYSKSLSWEISGSLNPDDGITCSATSQIGVGTARYTSIVTIDLADGSSTSYTETGILKNMEYTNAEVTLVPGKKKKSTEPSKSIEAPSPRV